MLWLICQQEVALVCACLPVCRRPLSYILPSSFGFGRSSTRDTSVTLGSARNQEDSRHLSSSSSHGYLLKDLS